MGWSLASDASPTTYLKPVLLWLLEALVALLLAFAFEAPTFFQFTDQQESKRSSPSSRLICPNSFGRNVPGKHISIQEGSSSPTEDKVLQKQEKQGAKEDQPVVKKAQDAKKVRTPKKGKASKKQQASNEDPLPTDASLEIRAPVSGPVMPPVAGRGQERFGGKVVAGYPGSNGSGPARKFAIAPDYKDGRIIFYTDGSFGDWANTKTRRAGAAVVYKKSEQDLWNIRAFHMHFDFCQWEIKDIETWAMAAALETAAACSLHASKELKEVKIFSDCLEAINIIENTKTYKKLHLTSRPGLEKFLHHASRLADAGVEVTLHWCPGHWGVPGNELADVYSSMGRKHDPERFSNTSTPKPLEFATTETHPDVRELHILGPVRDLVLPKVPLIASPSGSLSQAVTVRPKKAYKGPKRKHQNEDPEEAPIDEPEGLILILDKLATTQAMLVQHILDSKVQFDTPLIPAITTSATPIATLESSKPVALIEAPPNPRSSCQSPATIDNIIRLRPPVRLQLRAEVESNIRSLGLLKPSTTPTALPTPGLITLSSSEEELLGIKSPRSILYDSEPDSAISLDTNATSVGEAGGYEMIDHPQKEMTLGKVVSWDTNAASVGRNGGGEINDASQKGAEQVSTMPMDTEAASARCGGQVGDEPWEGAVLDSVMSSDTEVTDVTDLGPDDPVDASASDVRSLYLRQRFEGDVRPLGLKKRFSWL